MIFWDLEPSLKIFTKVSSIIRFDSLSISPPTIIQNRHLRSDGKAYLLACLICLFVSASESPKVMDSWTYIWGINCWVSAFLESYGKVGCFDMVLYDHFWSDMTEIDLWHDIISHRLVWFVCVHCFIFAFKFEMFPTHFFPRQELRWSHRPCCGDSQSWRSWSRGSGPTFKGNRDESAGHGDCDEGRDEGTRIAMNWVFPKIGVPQNGWFYNGKPYQNEWFRGSPIFGNTYIIAGHVSCLL